MLDRVARLIAGLVVCTLGGCAAEPGGPAELVIAPGAYERSFEAAKSAVLGQGFELDRVDARAGIITTRPKGSGGLATPWDPEQTTLEQEFEDFVNQQTRVARVSFWAEGADQEAAEVPDIDLRQEAGPMRARVEVGISRVHRPGWRIETTSVQQSRRWRDPDGPARGVPGMYIVPFTLDPHLAHRLAREIARRSEGADVVRIEAERPRPVQPPGRGEPAQGPRPSGYWD